MTEGPDLGAIHRIDQAQASAFQRITNLLDWIRDWMNNRGFEHDEMRDALDNPMIFVALVRILQQRVNVDELPNMLAAAIIRISKIELERK